MPGGDIDLDRLLFDIAMFLALASVIAALILKG